MSKILPATASASSQVTVDGLVVAAAEILSEGKQASSGVILFQGENVYYLTSSATDIKTTIEKLVDSLDKISSVLTTIGTTLTSIGAGMTGPTTAPPGTLATDVATINSKATEITAIKSELNTLKGALK